MFGLVYLFPNKMYAIEGIMFQINESDVDQLDQLKAEWSEWFMQMGIYMSITICRKITLSKRFCFSICSYGMFIQS